MTPIRSQGIDSVGVFIEVKDDGRYPDVIVHQGIEFDLCRPVTHWHRLVRVLPLYWPERNVVYRPAAPEASR